MKSRMDFSKTNAAAYQAMLHLERYVRGSGIDPTLLELIKIRASQINGCAFCIDMHTKMLGYRVKPNNEFMPLMPGEKRPFLLPKNGLPSPSPKL